MFKSAFKLICITAYGTALSGCAVVKTSGKVAALPFKATYKTTEFLGKGVVATTKGVGNGVIATGKGIGKGVMATGKGIYYVGTVPVKITDKALDTSSKVLTITTRALDASGKAISMTKQIKAAQLNAELAAVRTASNILSVTVDAMS